MPRTAHLWCHGTQEAGTQEAGTRTPYPVHAAAALYVSAKAGGVGDRRAVGVAEPPPRIAHENVQLWLRLGDRLHRAEHCAAEETSHTYVEASMPTASAIAFAPASFSGLRETRITFLGL